MSLANWTTRFLAGSAQGSDNEPDAPSGRSGGDAQKDEPAERGATQSLVGSRLGAYLITKRLGAGGVGEVFKGLDVMLKREVAIKILRPELARDPIFLERFRQEAQLHAKLSHPNVANVHAFLHEGDTQFMAMEYVAGITLDEFVRSGGPVPVERALSIFRRALDGIEHAHSCGIVHRDIKPANIMLADNGQVKVMDFGIARALDSQEHLTRHGHVAGTARSMSPEQIRGGQADVRSDVYSLGIVLYTLLAGRPPFDGATDYALMKAQLEQAPPPLHTLVDNVPPKVAAAVMRALEKDPSARFRSVAAFSRALDACLAELAVVSPSGPDQPDAHTSWRTVVNPALSDVQRLSIKEAAAGRDSQRPHKPRGMWPRLDRRAGGAALVLLAVSAAIALVWPRLARDEAPQAARSGQPQSAQAGVAPAATPVPSVQEATPAVAVRPATAQPIGATVQPRTLAIVRLPPEGATSAGAAAANRFKPGEQIKLLVTPSFDAHVYCYLQDEARRIVRFYPNRFSQGALVRAGVPLRIPGQMRFELVANTLGVTETVVCFASERDLMRELPAAVVGTDFAALAASSLDEVKGAFARAAADRMIDASFRVEFD